jgi:hypothetical protein
MGKLDTGSVGAEEGRGGVLHGEQGAAAGGGRWRWHSGRNSMTVRAGEHEQVMGKLARGSVGVMGDRRRRPTAASSSPV